MDIDLLSNMVRQLITDNDKVFLPGLGAFVAEIVPSTFSDKGFTVNPPYRRLVFRSRVEPDNLLSGLYVSSNGVARDVAEKIVGSFMEELRNELVSRKVIVFSGLGRLRATKENNFFFVQDEDLDIYPEGFGLEPVSLKTHLETKAEVSAVVSGLRAALDEAPEKASEKEDDAVTPENDGAVADNKEETAADGAVAGNAAEDVAEDDVHEDAVLSDTQSDILQSDTQSVLPQPEPAIADVTEAETEAEAETETEAETEAETETEVKTETAVEPAAGIWKQAGIAAAIVIGAAMVFLLVYLALAHLCPDFIDSLLYDAEELEVLRYGRQ